MLSREAWSAALFELGVLVWFLLALAESVSIQYLQVQALQDDQN